MEPYLSTQHVWTTFSDVLRVFAQISYIGGRRWHLWLARNGQAIEFTGTRAEVVKAVRFYAGW